MNEFEKIPPAPHRYRIIKYETQGGKVIAQFDDADLDTAYSSASNLIRHEKHQDALNIPDNQDEENFMNMVDSIHTSEKENK